MCAISYLFKNLKRVFVSMEFQTNGPDCLLSSQGAHPESQQATGS